MNELDCGCWYRCRCIEKAAGDKAVVLLKMVGINASSHPDSHSGSISLSLQPYEYYKTNYWSVGHLRHITYRSVDGLEKGVSRLIQRKIADPDYLELPVADVRGKFSLPSKGTRSAGRYCRPARSQ